MQKKISEYNLGLFYGLGAFLLWGLFPLYWSLFNDQDAFELLFQRVFWLIFFVLIYLFYKGKVREYFRVFRDWKVFRLLLISASLIGVNWFVFIWGVQVNRVSEVSLGYYINPLLNVLIGLVLLKERPRLGQWFCILLAFLAICYLTYNEGSLPWISIVLAVTFGLYGYARKMFTIEALPGLFVESLLVFCAIVLLFIYQGKLFNLETFQLSYDRLFVLSFAGIVTLTPLLLFVMSARRIKFMALGFLQFLAPSLHFLCAKYILGEEFADYKVTSFIFIWFAIALFLIESYYYNRKVKI